MPNKTGLGYFTAYWLILTSLCLGLARLNAQVRLIPLSPEMLRDSLLSRNKASLVQFWVPNCDNSSKVLRAYQKLQKRYAGQVDFYFIALTRQDSLVYRLVVDLGYAADCYILPPMQEDLGRQKQQFAQDLSTYLGAEQADFITAYFGPKGTEPIFSPSPRIRLRLLRRLTP